MANLKQAFEYASKNPNSDFAKNLESLAASGSLDQEAQKFGIDLTPFKPAPSILDTAKSIGGAIVNAPERLGLSVANGIQYGAQKQAEATGYSGTQTAQDLSKVLPHTQPQQQGVFGNTVDQLGYQNGEVMQDNTMVAKDVAGNIAQNASLVVGGGAGNLAKAGLVAKLAQGAKIGAIAGGLQGAGNALQEQQNAQGVVTQGLQGALLGGVAGGAIAGAPALASKVINSVPVINQAVKSATGKVVTAITPKAEEIMQRVARISKGKQANFEQRAGESVGTFLDKRGIYGDIDKISEGLYNRFQQAKSTADDALATLKGNFSPQPVQTALNELKTYMDDVSSVGAPAPELGRVTELMNKIENGGLDMSEINEVKRLYERNVKLDFLKSNNPKGVVKANVIDNSIRSWQVEKANTLGLKNLPDINKETMLNKQLLDDIGKEYAGSAGNNAITLTDWIMLSGGSPEAIAGFLAKKGFSSKIIQSAIAKRISTNKEKITGVKANLQTSEILGLPAPRDSIRSVVNGGKVKPNKAVTQEAMDAMAGKKSFSKPSVAQTDLIQEAKKYKTAEEFIKAQGTPIYHGAASNIQEKYLETGRGYSSRVAGATEDALYLSDSKNVADTFAKLNSGGEGKIFTFSNIGNLNLKKYKTLKEAMDNMTHAKNQGYDGISFPERGGATTALFDKGLKIAKTKSQLEKIWQEAHK